MRQHAQRRLRAALRGRRRERPAHAITEFGSWRSMPRPWPRFSQHGQLALSIVLGRRGRYYAYGLRIISPASRMPAPMLLRRRRPRLLLASPIDDVIALEKFAKISLILIVTMISRVIAQQPHHA